MSSNLRRIVGLVLFLLMFVGYSSGQGSFDFELELNGYSQMNGRIDFSIYDVAEGRNYWIGLSESKDGIFVEEWDRENRAVTVTYKGRSRIVRLRRDKVMSLRIKRSRMDILSDPEVLKRNEAAEKVEQSSEIDLLVGYVLQDEGRKARNRRLRSKRQVDR